MCLGNIFKCFWNHYYPLKLKTEKKIVATIPIKTELWTFLKVRTSKVLNGKFFLIFESRKVRSCFDSLYFRSAKV